jgi:hypothetical protein
MRGKTNRRVTGWVDVDEGMSDSSARQVDVERPCVTSASLSFDDFRTMHSATPFMTAHRSDVNQWEIRFVLRRSIQDKVILGNSFVPSYLRPLRNMPYMACSNFLATAMSACRRAFFRANRFSKKAFAWGSQRDATSAGM